jgi:hypothetical protein
LHLPAAFVAVGKWSNDKPGRKNRAGLFAVQLNRIDLAGRSRLNSLVARSERAKGPRRGPFLFCAQRIPVPPLAAGRLVPELELGPTLLSDRDVSPMPLRAPGNSLSYRTEHGKYMVRWIK